MNRRWLCSDVWMDILPSFDHAQLGLKMALLSDRFDVLVDKHFDGKSELTLMKLIIIKKDCGTKPKLFVRIDGKLVGFPLPDHPFPNNVRFRHLQIEYIDHTVLTFLRANKQIWDSKGTTLEMPMSETSIDDKQPKWDVLAREIWPIFAPSIRCLSLTDGAHFDPLCRRISPTILADLDQLNSIFFEYLFLHGIADDDGPNATSSASQALSKWLHTPRKDGQLKTLLWSDTELYEEGSLDWINSLKETFIRATASVSYQIAFGIGIEPSPTPIEPFELVNERTNEKLTLQKGGYIYWELKRCPIVGETTDPWDEDENWDSKFNMVKFSLCDGNNCIGPLSPLAEEED